MRSDISIFAEFIHLENLRTNVISGELTGQNGRKYENDVYQFELDNTIRWEYVAFGQDMEGNEIWAVSYFRDSKRLYIIPNGTFSKMKAAINNVITLKDIKGIYGIACEDKDWYIYFNSHYYKFQIKQSNGKYSIDKWQSTSNLFPESNNQDETGRLKENLKNQNWRWDGSPGQLRSRQYPNNITFIKSDKGKTLSYKYNGQEQKQIYNGQNIWGFYYNQKGRVMICDVGEWDRDQKGYLGYKLVLITIPELYWLSNFAEYNK